MAALIVRHKVRDYDSWLPIFIEHGEVRRRYGGTGHQVYRLGGDPNDLTVVNLFETLDGARRFAQDPSLAEVMGRAGVISEPQELFCEEADAATYSVAVG